MSDESASLGRVDALATTGAVSKAAGLLLDSATVFGEPFPAILENAVATVARTAKLLASVLSANVTDKSASVVRVEFFVFESMAAAVIDESTSASKAEMFEALAVTVTGNGVLLLAALIPNEDEAAVPVALLVSSDSG